VETIAKALLLWYVAIAVTVLTGWALHAIG
jgi:hypothetical protein